MSGDRVKLNIFPYEAAKLMDRGYLFVPSDPTLGTTPRGAGAHAEGWHCFAYTDAHAEGVKCQAVGKFSHASGIANRTGWCSTAIGKGNSAYGFESIAMGAGAGGDSATAKYDSNCVVWAPKAFAWSGTATPYVVPANLARTFNVNPEGGAEGFRIGDRTLASIVAGGGKDVVKSVLSSAFEGKTDADLQRMGLLDVIGALSALYQACR